MPEPDLVGNWTSLWLRAIALDRAGRGAQREVREPFQLFVAALYLHRRSLDSFLTSGGLHSPIRGQDHTVGPRDVLTIPPDTLVTCGDIPQVFGQVNLASASLRLPVALLQTAEACASVKLILHNRRLLKYQRGLQAPAAVAIDWNRSECANHIESVKALKCCKSGLVPTCSEMVAALLAHRDDYGHGEMGVPRIPVQAGATPTGTDIWILNREACLNEIYRCRLFQVQQLLIDMALTGLETAP